MSPVVESAARMPQPPCPSAPLVELRDVGKRFGRSVAVQQASLALRRGEFLTILGPSGCGKTTLLRMIAGFIRPDGGEILINGEHVERVPPHRRSIGMVFQRLALFPHLSAAQNIAYPLRMRRFERGGIDGRVRRYLSLVRLDGLGGRYPHELSGGQQQRVAIARALSFEPDLLLLDEPLSALDRKLREEMQLEFRRIQQQLGVTTINVTHDQREALVMSDRVVVMDNGRVQQADAPETVYHAPANPFVASFLGMTSTFGAVIEAVTGDRLVLRAGDLRLYALRAEGKSAAGAPAAGTPAAGAPAAGTPAAGGAVDCALRAERIRLLSGDPGPERREPRGADDSARRYENVVSGRLLRRIFEGDRVVYEVAVPALGERPLLVLDYRQPDREDALTPGAAVRLGWQADDLFTFAAGGTAVSR